MCSVSRHAPRVRRLAALLLITCVGSSRAEEPLLGTIDGRVIVRGEVTNKQQALSLVDSVVADVGRRFDTKLEKPITLLLYSDEARYRDVAASTGEVISDWGFYLPDKRVAIANLGASIGNLRHELVHPLLGDGYPGIPAWLNEGIASLYGSAKLGKHGFTFLVNYRLRDLQRALAKDALPNLAALAKTTPMDLHGDRAMMWYAYARYVLLYVDRKGALRKMYGELRASSVDKHPAILARYVDEQAFRAWAKKLRY